VARPKGSRNKRTLQREREAAAIAAGTGPADEPRGVPTLTRILKYWLGEFDRQLAKPEGERDGAAIAHALGEARITAGMLAQYQAPRLSAVAVGITKKIVEVHGALGPRQIAPPPALAVVPKADDAA
jgi:hypothetical protein